MAPTPSEPAPADALRAARQALLGDRSLAGAALRRALTDVTDRWLTGLLGAEPGVALVAVGGYGRGEPAAGSDLDLVLLHHGRSDIGAVADRLWYPIWDTGVGLDHSVRTPDEALRVAREDLKAALGLLDARHVAGDADLTEEVRRAALAAWRRDARSRLPALAAAVHERAERFGELPFLLEPDLKEARGGIRDVHAMTAAAAAWVVDAPGERVRAALALLLDVRGELHRGAVRPSDRLVQQEQSPVAAALGFADADDLLRAVSSAGRAIAFAADETWRRVAAAQRPAPRRLGRSRSRGPQRRPLAADVVEQDGEVVLARDADVDGDPVLPVRAAAAAAQAGLPLAPHALQRLAASPARLPEPWPTAARDAFVALLGAGAGAVAVVEALDQAGVFARLLPEWDAVRCKPQRNAVHRFTVDRHLVETAVRCAELTRRVHRPDLLLLGGLLHDLGKGFPGDHSEAGVALVPAVAARMGLPTDDAQTLVTLVRHHLLLPDTATRRDLDDPATLAAVAAAVGDRDRLDLLHALTEADALATGPGAWTDWKARLVADLVARTRATLSGAAMPVPALLDERRLELARAGVLAVDVAGSTVTVVAPDRPGLLSRWAGVMALHRLEIHAATATSVGPSAVTVLQVSPRFGSLPDWDLVRADVRRAFDEALPLEAALAERERAYSGRGVPVAAPRVVWVDEASTSATVVEVRAHDSVGLLHRLTRALADAGLDVRAARISTLGAEAVDAFYVVGPDGAPLRDPAARERLEQALLTAAQPAG